MKIIFKTLIAVLFTTAINAQNGAIDKYFSAYENSPEFTVVYVSPKMFEMMATATKDNKDEVLQLVKEIKGLKILSTEKGGAKYYAEATKKIPINDYEVLMTVKDNGENIKFLTKGKGDLVNELLLIIGGGENFTLMSFVGNLDLNKIAKLANKLNIDGVEHLGKLKDKK